MPAVRNNRLFNELKGKLVRDIRGEQGGVVGGAGKMLKKLSIGLLSNFKSGDKWLITKLVEKLGSLKEGELREMGLSMCSLGNMPVDFRIGNIIIYCVGGGCLSEQANL